MDASIVDAPSSTKNAKGGRDPEMHQTRKGNQWYFGMKAHIGVDAETGLAHSLGRLLRWHCRYPPEAGADLSRAS